MKTFKKCVVAFTALVLCLSLAKLVPIELKAATGYTEAQIVENNYVLYLVNCGTPDASVVPNGYKMGLYQSNVHQQYAVDAETSLSWGYEPNDANSYIVAGGNNATSLTGCYIYMSDTIPTFVKGVSGFKYKFELPERANCDYKVTIGVQNPWSARDIDVKLEGQTVESNLRLTEGTLVEREYEVEVTDGELNLMVHSPNRQNIWQDPVLSYIIVKAVPEGYGYTSITGTNGAELFDNNGKRIQAHGGQIQQFTIDGETRYYWYGEDKTNGYRPVGGVHLYTSKDLYNWKDEGLVLRSIPVSSKDYGKDQQVGYVADLSIFEQDSYFKNLYSEYKNQKADDPVTYSSKLEEIYWNLAEDRCVIERPKVLYNEKTGKYVMWFHSDGRTPNSSGDYDKARAGVAISDSPTGPFKLLGTYRLHISTAPDVDHSWDNVGGAVRDMNVFKDSADNGQAYVIYSSDGNTTTYIAKLNDEYTGLIADVATAVEGTGKAPEELIKSDYTRAFIGASREAPAMFMYNGKYYMINSGCTGWDPNKAQYAVADHPLGPWTVMGDPCVGDTKGTTFDTQSTCVFPVDAEKGQYIYMGDRWNKNDLSDSRYVWLPVEFLPGDKLELKAYADWTLEELENKGSFVVVTKLPTIAESVEQISSILPSSVQVDFGNGSVRSNVTWSTNGASSNKLGVISVTGILEKGNRVFTHEISIINPDMLYFFDCGSSDSVYFDLLKQNLGTNLLNEVPEQKYSEKTGAGYVGVTQFENSGNFDLGWRDGSDYLSDGWWAAGNRDIVYSFDLEPGRYTIAAGFQEWWNATRACEMAITNSEGTVLTNTAFTIWGSSADLQVDSRWFEINEADTITVTIRKTGSPDPVISWISVVKEGHGDNVIIPSEKLLYIDVAETDWYYDAVYYNYFAGLMTGKSATIFAPDASLSRAEFASVLYSANDEPDVTYEATFPDVAESEWYADAVIWANKAGIINGYKNGSFGPYDSVAREQIAVMMYNYAIAKGYDTTQTADLSAFNDGTEVSDYAKEAMQWAVGSGVITGKNGGIRLDAYGSTTRAECAAIMQRFMENCAK